MIGSQARCAMGAMSRLAEVYDGGKTLVSATDIADSRGLQRPFVSKTLSSLSQAGLVTGSRGPGGGFTLSRPPEEITLHDVICIFERSEDVSVCPFGGGICGDENPCPLHHRMKTIKETTATIIHETTFVEFTDATHHKSGTRELPSRKKSSTGKKPRPSPRRQSGRRSEKPADDPSPKARSSGKRRKDQ